MSGVKSYFDSHSHVHAYHRPPSTYYNIAEYLKENFGIQSLNILDLGCGDGSFIKAMNGLGLSGRFFAVDLSFSMIVTALEDLRETCDLAVADGFNLPIKVDIKYDVIHLDCVLHHLIGRSTTESKFLAQSLFTLMHDRLSEKGIIILEEIYYNSFLFSEFTSKMIFYGLKLLSKLSLNLNSLSNKFHPGLEVNFFSEESLYGLFSKHSNDIHELHRTSLRVPRLYRFLFLKEFGRISCGIRR